MDTIFWLIIMFISLYNIVARRIRRFQRKKAAAEEVKQASYESDKYMKITARINSDFVLHSSNIFVTGVSRDIYGAFVYLTEDGVSFCLDTEPDDFVTIPYKNIRYIEYSPASLKTSNCDAVTFVSRLDSMTIKISNENNNSTTVIFSFFTDPSRAEFAFNRQSMQKGNFFAELEKHLQHTLTPMEEIAKVFE